MLLWSWEVVLFLDLNSEFTKCILLLFLPYLDVVRMTKKTLQGLCPVIIVILKNNLIRPGSLRTEQGISFPLRYL